MYKKYYKDLLYISNNKENNIYCNKKDEESEKGFRYLKLNEKNKKMFDVGPERSIFEEVVKSYEVKDNKIPYLNLDFLNFKTKEKIREENSRKFGLNSVNSDI